MANSWIVKHLQVNPINGNPTRVNPTLRTEIKTHIAEI